MCALHGRYCSVLIIVAITAKAGIESWKMQRKSIFETDLFVNVSKVKQGYTQD